MGIEEAKTMSSKICLSVNPCMEKYPRGRQFHTFIDRPGDDTGVPKENPEAAMGNRSRLRDRVMAVRLWSIRLGKTAFITFKI